MNRTVALMLPILLSLSPAQAQVPPEVERAIVHRISTTLSDFEVTRITESPIPGMYQVQLGVDVVYVSGDGRYLLKGDLLDLKDKANLSESVRKKLRQNKFEAIPEDEYIEFAPSSGTRHVLYVYTDVRCGYCRRLHNNMAEMNRLGLAIRYLAFPVIGEQKEAIELMNRVWCADDRNKALTQAKAGNTRLQAATCKSPVRKQFMLGRDMGVNGTPAMYLEDGTELPGYMEPAQILQHVRG